MSDQNHYVEMMQKSLQKKDVILEGLLKECRKQAAIIAEPDITWKDFDDCIQAKQVLIEELVKLDDGFTDLYERMKEEFANHKSQYKTEIQQMQNLIKRITDRSVQIQTEEERNRKAVEKALLQAKNDIRCSKATVKAASDYYKVMSKVNLIDPQFMDQKK